MNLSDSSFKYSVVIKNAQDVAFEGLQLFPGLNEISFASRTFSNYAECIKSCKTLMEDVTKDLNAHLAESKFKVGAEVNPIHTGIETLSKDWAEFEVARFWVFDRSMEGSGGKIDAIGKGSVMVVQKLERGLTH